jgi:hypothetical protein
MLPHRPDPDGALRQKKVKAFRDWLLYEMSGDRIHAGRVS